MMLHIPKGCIHSFTKLGYDDANYLLQLMARWNEWETIHPGVKKMFQKIQRHLEADVSAITQGAPPTRNFLSVAHDW